MRNVSEELIKRINNYVLVQKVSIEAVLVLIDRDLQIYADDIKDHIKKYIQYLVWLDDNNKDKRNSWEKYISRVEWLESKNSTEEQNSNSKIKRLVQDLEIKEADLKKRKENDARIESIYRKFWEEQAEKEKVDVQLSFEEVVLSNGETMIATLIEEPVEHATETSEELAVVFDDGLNTILTEDEFEETHLESIIKGTFLKEEVLNSNDVKPNTIIDDLDSLEELEFDGLLTDDILGEIEATKQEDIIKNDTLIESVSDEELNELYTDLSNDQLLDQIGSKLDNTQSDLYKLKDEDLKKDFEIATSDYYLFEEKNSDQKTKFEEKVDNAQNFEDTFSSSQENFVPNFFKVEDDVIEDGEFIVFDENVPNDEENTGEALLLNNKNEDETFENEFNEHPSIEKESTINDELLNEDESYLTVRKFDDDLNNKFELNEDEKTLFDSSQDDELTMDQSMFEDSTIQSFADGHQPTLDAFEFLNNLEEKYSTLLDFDPESLSETADEAQMLQDRTTNTLDALDFIDRMDSKYAEILNTAQDENETDDTSNTNKQK